MPSAEASSPGAHAATAGAADAWVIHCDGSALPNPGRMGLGAVMVAPDGSRHTLSQAPHGTGCNNEAELRALLAALDAVQAWGASVVEVYSDSSILVEQLAPVPARPVARLAPLYAAARLRLGSFSAVRLHWLPQHRNAEADGLARAALGLPVRLEAAPAGRKGRKRRR